MTDEGNMKIAQTILIAIVLSVGQADRVSAQLFGPYSWEDKKGNCVRAERGTISGEQPDRMEIPLDKIKDQFFGVSGAALADHEVQEYVREQLSEAEREALFRALQRALADTGKARYRVNAGGGWVAYIGVPKGSGPTIFRMNGLVTKKC